MQATSSQILASQILKTMTNYTSKPYLQILFSNWKTKTKQNKKASKTLLKLYSIIQDIFLIKSGRSFHNLGAASLLMYSQIWCQTISATYVSLTDTTSEMSGGVI